MVDPILNPLGLGGELVSNLPSPRDDQDLKNWSSVNTNGTVNHYTVPTGKRVFVSLFAASSSAINNCNLQITATVVATLWMPANGAYQLSFPTPILYVAGDIIRTVVNGITTTVTVVGWEEDA